MFRKRLTGAAVAAPLALMASTLVAPASADPVEDCDFVPLTYTKNYSAGGEQFTTKTNLKVYDLCDAGTFTGYMAIKGRNETTTSDLLPTTPRLAYKRQLDPNFRSTGVDPLKKVPVAGLKDWRAYRVTTEDIDFEPSGGYFLSVRLRWTVQVDGDNYTKTVICDRINNTGRNAYSCKNA